MEESIDMQLNLYPFFYFPCMKKTQFEDAKSIQAIIKEIGSDVRNDAGCRGSRVTYMRDGGIIALENGKESFIRLATTGPSIPMPKRRRLPIAGTR